MYEQEEKNSKFLEAINNAALKQCQDVEGQLKSQLRLEMERAEDKIHAECHSKMEKAMRKIERATDASLAKYSSEKRELLSQRRQFIEKNVFDKAKEKILLFTKTEKYFNIILNSAKEITGILKSDDIVVFVREEDMVFADKIKDIIGKCEIVKDENNNLGGIRAQSEKLKLSINDTFCSRLEQQKKWFSENSDLKIV